MAAPTLPPPPVSSPIAPGGSPTTPPWARWFQQLQSLVQALQVLAAGALHPTTPGLASQAGAVYQGSGVPNDAQGSNGDVYLRTDTPGTANQRLYVRAAGSWVGIL